MKIPQILAETAVGVPQVPRLPVGGNGGGGAALGQGLAGVAQSLVDVAEIRERKRLKFAEDEARAAYVDYQYNAKTFDAGLRGTQRDPDAYDAALRRYLDEQEATLARGLTTAEGRALFSTRVKGARVEIEASAITHTNALYKDRAVGLEDATTDRLYHLAGLAPIEDQAIWLRRFSEAQQAIEANRWLHGDTETAKRLAASRQLFFEQRFRRHVLQDPEDAIAKSETVYAGLDPKVRDQLVEQGERERERQRTEARAAEERQTKEFRNDVARELTDRIEAGEDVQERIQALSFQLGRERVSELYTLNRGLRDKRDAVAVKGESDAAKDASSRLRVILTAGILGKEITRQGQILEAADLLPADAVALLGTLRQEQGRAETDRDKVITEGRAILRERLRTTGDLDFDALGSEVLARAMTDYTTTLRRDETADPLLVLQQIVERYAPAVVSRRELSAADVAKMITENPDLARHLSEGRRSDFERQVPEAYRTGDARGKIIADWKAGTLTEARANELLRLLRLLDVLGQPARETPRAPARPARGAPKEKR